MSTINEAFINALLADASYVEDLEPNQTSETLKGRLEDRMTPTLAMFIADNFEVVAHKASGDLLGTGFDATVWRAKPSSAFAGQVYVSMRGTEFSGQADLFTDIDLTVSGGARSQFVTMVNWWNQITTPVGQMATQIGESQLSGRYFTQIQRVPGTGTLQGVTAVNVNGHSLGGHLATAFARIYSGGLTVNGISTFNSAGFTPLSEIVFADLKAVMGIGASDYLRNVQTNYFAQHGINVTTNTIINQIGTRVGLFNENSTTQVPNHFMYKLTDALALAVALEKLDPSMTIERANALFEAGANNMAGSLEGVLDGLRRLLLAPGLGRIPTGDVNDSHPSRVTFHEVLAQLQQSDAFKAVAGFARLSPVSLGTTDQARSSFSALASLLSLSPVALSGTDVVSQGIIDAALAPVWGDTYGQWQADRQLLQSGGDLAALNFSDRFLQDRAEMLGWLAERNIQDIDGATSTHAGPAATILQRTATGLVAGEPTNYYDRTSQSRVLVGGGVFSARRVVEFGSQAADTLSGSERDDHLYGNAGNDTLSGQGGNDYLEGNRGDDRLEGGAGNDTLVGGADNDTYVFTGGFDRDVVIDSDGKGSIVWNGAALPQGLRIADGLWQSEDRKVTYTLVADAAPGRQDLVISFADSTDRIVVRNWNDTDRSLGVTFGGDMPMRGTSRNYVGDYIKQTQAGPDGKEYYVFDAEGNYAQNGVENGAPDVIFGAYTSDAMFGLWGDDALFGYEGDDRIDGGDGNDVLQGGSGLDWLIGGEGADYLYGSSAGSFGKLPAHTQDFLQFDQSEPGTTVAATGFNWIGLHRYNPDGSLGYQLADNVRRDDGYLSDQGNVLDAGSGDDGAVAGQGNDLVIAGSGRDRVYGMAGTDTLLGGADADEIHGDGPIGPLSGIVVDVSDERFGADVIAAGAGNDLVYGEGNDDLLFGGADDDEIFGDHHDTTQIPIGFHGNDYLDGGAGNDILQGDGKGDTLLGGDGHDLLYGDSTTLEWEFHGADHLDGGDGIDGLYGQGGNDTLLGGRGNDLLDGGTGDDTLRGGADIDTLYGRECNDVLDGGDGADYLDGGPGDDTYIIGSGDSSTELPPPQDGPTNAGNPDPFTAAGTFDPMAGSSASSPANTIAFETIESTEGNDTIVLDGANLSDLQVRAGLVASEDGDVFTLQWSTRSGVHIKGGATASVGSVRIDGAEHSMARLLGERLQSEVVATAWRSSGNLMGGAMADTLVVRDLAAMTTVSGGRGSDRLELWANRGATIKFNRGDGMDFVSTVARAPADSAQGTPAAKNVLELSAEIAAADLQLFINGTNAGYTLLLGAGDGIRFAPTASPMTETTGPGAAPFDEVRLADGTVVTWQQLLDRAALAGTVPTDGNDVLLLSSAHDTVDGLTGNDIIDGGDGEDRLNGGDGNDTLIGGGGIDMLSGGAGSDLLIGGDGSDHLLGGNSGYDTLYGGDGEDILTFGLGASGIADGGSGSDRIFGFGSGKTALFGRNSGYDTISGVSKDGEGGTLLFGSDISAGDLTFSLPFNDPLRSYGQQLDIGIAGTNDMVSVNRFLAVDGSADADNPLERIQFSNGMTLSKEDILRVLYGTTSGVFEGGAGVDLVAGGRGNDMLSGHDGGDVLWGLEGDDRLIGGAGRDDLRGGTGSDFLDGGSDDDDLAGGSGNDQLYGGDGYDILTGGAGDDLLDSEVGRGAVLSGGAGNNIYRFGRGYGVVELRTQYSSAGSTEVIEIAADVNPTQLTAIRPRASNDLRLQIAGTTDSLTVIDYFTPDGRIRGIDAIRFADGTVWSYDAVPLSQPVPTSGNDTLWGFDNADVIAGGAGDDDIYGGGGNDLLYGDDGNDIITSGVGSSRLYGGDGYDTLIPGSNTDILVGGPGPDIYGSNFQEFGATIEFSRGDGNPGAETGDRVLRATGATIKFAPDILPSQVVLRNHHDNMGLYYNALRIRVTGTNDLIDVQDFFSRAPAAPEGSIVKLVFADGTVWDQATLLARAMQGTDDGDWIDGSKAPDLIQGRAGNDRLDGLDGNDTVEGGTGDDYLGGGGGNDVLYGGAGYDFMIGGDGDDTYLWGRGDGYDILGGDPYVDQNDVVRITAGTLPGDVSVQGTGLGLNLVVNGTTDTLVLYSRESDPKPFKEVQFSDGTVWSIDHIRHLALAGSALDDTINAPASADVITGKAGNDFIDGNGGDDSIDGGSGNDSIFSRDGDDVISGGAGADTLLGGAGDDEYIFRRGDGEDQIWSESTTGEINTLRFGEGINPGSVKVRPLYYDETLSGNLELTINGTTDRVEIQRFFDNGLADHPDNPITRVVFADGTVWNRTQLVEESQKKNLIVGTDGAEELVGTALADLIRGLAGDDTLRAGAGDDTLEGGDGNDLLDGQSGADTMNGGPGNDTYVIESAADVVTELAGEGVDLVQSSAAFTLGTNVENLTLTGTATAGTGNDLDNVLIGNGANNTLVGGAGNDTLDGGLGNDTMQGGAGNDTYVVNVAGDVVSENASEGIDTVRSAATLTLSANVENLTLTGSTAIHGTGNTLDNIITGNGANNTLAGGAGNDTLDGGLGSDTLQGGAGNDTYVVDVATDVVTENAGEGTDTVRSAVTLTLTANVENLTLSGTSAINGTGNALVNIITGNGAANTLDGGAGADTLAGGAGNDSYVVDNTADVITELANEGTDTVSSNVTYTLSANVENLTLTGSSAINGTGNTLDNVITGNGANNTLAGGAGNDTLDGGLGSDTLQGGAGNDTYVVDVATDVVTENTGEGIDTVRSAVTLTLGANVENLTLTGSGVVNGTGNALDNVLVGNGAANTLTGGDGNDTLDGGAGTDNLVGGLGNDTYFLDVATDKITENAGGGIDTVNSAFTMTLATNLENLTLTGTAGISATGNADNNVLTGNTGANVLSGLGGNDTYDGGAGNDTLTDNSTTSADVYRFGIGYGTDTITDSGGTDTVQFGAGITAAQLTFRRNVNNLEVTIAGQTDKLIVANWYSATANRIEQFRLNDGSTIPLSVVPTTAAVMTTTLQSGAKALLTGTVKTALASSPLMAATASDAKRAVTGTIKSGQDDISAATGAEHVAAGRAGRTAGLVGWATTSLQQVLDEAWAQPDSGSLQAAQTQPAGPHPWWQPELIQADDGLGGAMVASGDASASPLKHPLLGTIKTRDGRTGENVALANPKDMLGGTVKTPAPEVAWPEKDMLTGTVKTPAPEAAWPDKHVLTDTAKTPAPDVALPLRTEAWRAAAPLPHLEVATTHEPPMPHLGLIATQEQALISAMASFAAAPTGGSSGATWRAPGPQIDSLLMPAAL